MLNKKSLRKGFTLIELMTVISIISLLSSVIFASTYEARAKATNGQIASQAKESEKAFALLKDSTPTGFVDTGNTTTYYCVGKSAAESCTFWGLALTGNVTLKTASDQYIKPFILGSVVVDGLEYQGIVYKCKTRTAQGCTASAIYWAQKNGTCLFGLVVVSGAGGVVCGQNSDGAGTDHVESAPSPNASRCPSGLVYTEFSWPDHSQFYKCTTPDYSPATIGTCASDYSFYEPLVDYSIGAVIPFGWSCYYNPSHGPIPS